MQAMTIEIADNSLVPVRLRTPAPFVDPDPELCQCGEPVYLSLYCRECCVARSVTADPPEL